MFSIGREKDKQNFIENRLALLAQYGEDSDDEEGNSDTVATSNARILQSYEAPKPEDATIVFFRKLLEYKNDPDADYLVKAEENRGKFRVSHNGRCPKCASPNVAFVILDYLFPAGDMPGILSYLISKGQAVLWSSQDNSKCKEPPTFMCRGRCPSEPQKSGFNLNWKKSDLGKIFLFPEEDVPVKKAVKEKIGTISVKGLTAKKKENVGPTRSFSWEVHIEQKNPVANVPITADRTSFDKQLSVEEAPLDQNTTSAKDLPSPVPEETSQDTNDAVLERTNDISDEFDADEVDMHYYKTNVYWVVLDEEVEEDMNVERNTEEEDLLIRQMLALEEAKEDWEKGEAKLIQISSDSDSESSGAEDMNISDDDEHSTPIEVSVSSIDKSVYSLHHMSDLTSPWNSPNSLKNQKKLIDSVSPVPSTATAPFQKTVGSLNSKTSNLPMSYRQALVNNTFCRPRMPFSPMQSFTSSRSGLPYSPRTTRPHITPTCTGPPQITYSSTPILYKGPDDISNTVVTPAVVITTEDPTPVYPSITSSTVTSSSTAVSSSPSSATVTSSVASDAPDEKITTHKYCKSDFPVSKDGACPYCKSSDVLYIILTQENSRDEDLPPVLNGLLQKGYAYKMPKGDSEPPSFQCKSCTYGFNLDWASTTLEEIFRKKEEQAVSETTSTTPPTSIHEEMEMEMEIPVHVPAQPRQPKQRFPNFRPRHPFPPNPAAGPMQQNMPFPMQNMQYPVGMPGFGVVPYPGVHPMQQMQWNQGFCPPYPPPNAGNIPPMQQQFQQQMQQQFQQQMQEQFQQQMQEQFQQQMQGQFQQQMQGQFQQQMQEQFQQQMQEQFQQQMQQQFQQQFDPQLTQQFPPEQQQQQQYFMPQQQHPQRQQKPTIYRSKKRGLKFIDKKRTILYTPNVNKGKQNKGKKKQQSVSAGIDIPAEEETSETTEDSKGTDLRGLLGSDLRALLDRKKKEKADQLQNVQSSVDTSHEETTTENEMIEKEYLEDDTTEPLPPGIPGEDDCIVSTGINDESSKVVSITGPSHSYAPDDFIEPSPPGEANVTHSFAPDHSIEPSPPGEAYVISRTEPSHSFPPDDVVEPSPPGEANVVSRTEPPHSFARDDVIEPSPPGEANVIRRSGRSHSFAPADAIEPSPPGEDHEEENLRAPGTDDNIDDTNFVMDTFENKVAFKTIVSDALHSNQRETTKKNYQLENNKTEIESDFYETTENTRSKTDDVEQCSDKTNETTPSESDVTDSVSTRSGRGRRRGRGRGKGSRGGRGKKKGSKSN